MQNQTPTPSKVDYLPFIVVDGVTHNLLAAHVCIDFGGRQFSCEFQSEPNEEGKRLLFSKTYYPLTNEWGDSEWPTDNLLTKQLHNFMAAFDTTSKLTVKV